VSTSRRQARVLDKIVAANAVPLRHDGGEIRASVSVGAAGYPRDASDEEALRKLADAAMYVAKGAGGNRWVAYGR
jgi:GGDEF domain-containing protein